MSEHRPTIAEEFAGQSVSLRHRDVPPEVMDYAKRLVLDFCGNALAGVTTDSFETAVAAFSYVPSGDFTIIGSRPMALPEYAAMLNAVAGHSLETDDIQNRSSIHLGVVVIPAVLAACERSAADGATALRAIIAGYEVAGRIGRAVNAKDHYGKGFHPTATCGPYGAAMGAAFVLGLDEEQTTNAIALASVGSAGLLQFLIDGSLIKRLHPGWACHAGIVAAQMASAGYTGPRGIFEGANGFLRAYSDQPDETQARGSWDPPGRELMDTAIKPHATCRYNQSPVDGVLELVTGHDLKPEEISEIRIGLLGVAWRIVAHPADQKKQPRSVVDAQFSVPFAAAVAAVRRRTSVDEHTMTVIEDPQIVQMMDRVVAVHQEELDGAYPERWPATVTVKTKDGRTLETRVDHPKGDPQNPLTWDETVTKFKTLTFRMRSESQEQIIGLVNEIESVGDMRQLMRALGSTNGEVARDA